MSYPTHPFSQPSCHLFLFRHAPVKELVQIQGKKEWNCGAPECQLLNLVQVSCSKSRASVASGSLPYNHCCIHSSSCFFNPDTTFLNVTLSGKNFTLTWEAKMATEVYCFEKQPLGKVLSQAPCDKTELSAGKLYESSGNVSPAC